MTRHSTPWVPGDLPPVDDDVWELYDTTSDWSQSRDLAAEQPEKLEELKRLFLIEAVKYGVLPLDDRRVERFNPDLAGRPTLIHGNRQLLFPGMARLSENSMINVKNKTHAVTAQFAVPEGGANGVLVAQGGGFGGWCLFLDEGRPSYCYNLFGMTRFHVQGADTVPAGDHQLRMEFVYDGGGFGKGGAVTLYLDGNPVAEGRVQATVPMIFSLDETADVGQDLGTTVSDRYTARDEPFTGSIEWVEIDIDDAAAGRGPRARRRGATADRDGAAVVGASSDSQPLAPRTRPRSHQSYDREKTPEPSDRRSNSYGAVVSIDSDRCRRAR